MLRQVNSSRASEDVSRVLFHRVNDFDWVRSVFGKMSGDMGYNMLPHVPPLSEAEPKTQRVACTELLLPRQPGPPRGVYRTGTSYCIEMSVVYAGFHSRLPYFIQYGCLMFFGSGC